MPYFNPLKLNGFEAGDLLAIGVGESRYVHGVGTQIWLEFHVAEVFSVGEYGRLKAVRFAVDGSVARRKDLHRLVSLSPTRAADIDVPAAMAAARTHGKPFRSLETLRDLVRPFRLVTPHDAATCAECTEPDDAQPLHLPVETVPVSDVLAAPCEQTPAAPSGPHPGVPHCEGCPQCIGYPDPDEPDDEDGDDELADWERELLERTDGNTLIPEQAEALRTMRDEEALAEDEALAAEQTEAAALAEEQEDAPEQTFVGRYLVPADRAAHSETAAEPVVLPDSVWLEPAERTSLANQLRALGAIQAAQDEDDNVFHVQQGADEAERRSEYADGGEQL